MPRYIYLPLRAGDARQIADRSRVIEGFGNGDGVVKAVGHQMVDTSDGGRRF